jgi:hypothetical protein
MDKHDLTEFQNWTKPLIGQPDGLTPSYISEEIRDNWLREFTLREHEEPVSLWLCALNLLAFAFEPGNVYTAPGPAPDSTEDNPEARIGRAAYTLRLQLIGLSGRASKPALDLTLSGYYTEAWTLLRTMLDGWARAVYVRIRPKEHVRWYASEDEGPQKEPPHWGEIEGVIGKDGNDEDPVGTCCASRDRCCGSHCCTAGQACDQRFLMCVACIAEGETGMNPVPFCVCGAGLQLSCNEEGCTCVPESVTA